MKYITAETINHFKKFISRLHKKEEEALLNKKKKREEVKQKNKYEKNKLNNLNNPNHFPYYPGMYMPPMQINNQNPAYFNEYQNFYYLNPPPYPLNQQMMGNPYYPPFMMQQNSLEDSLNIMYNRGIVNNIIGAFFIKDCQDRQRKSEKRKVPISTVELNDEQGDDNNADNNNENNNDINDESNNKLSYMVNDFKLKTENTENNNTHEEKDENNLKNDEQGELKEKKDEEENKEENSEHDENELKKPSMI